MKRAVEIAHQKGVKVFGPVFPLFCGADLRFYLRAVRNFSATAKRFLAQSNARGSANMT